MILRAPHIIIVNELQSVLLQAFSVPPPYWPGVLRRRTEKLSILQMTRSLHSGSMKTSFGWRHPVSSVGVACVAVPIIHRRAGHGHNLMNQQIRDAFSHQFESVISIHRQIGSIKRFDMDMLANGTRKLAPIPDIRRQHTLPIFELDPTNPTTLLKSNMHLERARRGHGCHIVPGSLVSFDSSSRYHCSFLRFRTCSAPEAGMHCPSSIWLSLPAFVRGPGHPKPSSRSNIVAGSGAPSTHSRRVKWHGPTKDPLTLTSLKRTGSSNNARAGCFDSSICPPLLRREDILPTSTEYYG